MADTTFSVDLETLLEAGCHFGHQVRRWNPKMAEYIYAQRDGVHIFDLAKTAAQIEEACAKLHTAGKLSQTVVFVATKRQSSEMTKAAAADAGANFIVTRWPGGLLTNWEQVGKSIVKLNQMKKDFEEGKFSVYTKYEQGQKAKEIARLERFFGGAASLKKIPDIIVVADINKEIVAVKEARAKGVFIIAIADSNTDPNLVDIAIPANDDAVGSVKIIIETLAKAFKDGKAVAPKSN